MIRIQYKGTRWFKCDLHLHTTASACFQEQTITAEAWVNRAIEQGLNCVAVTDHNTGLSINDIKAAALGTGLIVFPGVEITCDTSKIHILILFDVNKTTDDINDFLIKCGINRDDFGKQDTHTSKNIFDVAEIGNNDGALVIPAHIDEYNGLGSISVANIKKFYDLDYINAVQVVHKDFTSRSLVTAGNAELKTSLNDYYSNPTPAIDEATIKEWHTPVKYALDSNLAILTFSDNPHEPKNSKHGLWGIGSHFTWIKMDEVPTLEGLRQAFLLPEFRIKNEFDSPSLPYQMPDLWIKSIQISNTEITHGTEPLKLDFSPQLNTIIGGRGSGKSSVLRFLRGLFNRTADLMELNEIMNDHNDFYKRQSSKNKKGILNENSIIEIEFIRNKLLHKFKSSDITNSQNQKIEIVRQDTDTGEWELITDIGYSDFFEFEHYSQKQIYEIAQEPNALRERIDSAIEGVEKLKSDREIVRNLFLEKSASIRTADSLVAGKGKIETTIKDLDTSIKKLQQSGIADILTAKEKFNTHEDVFTSFTSELTTREESLESLLEPLELPDIDFNKFELKHSVELAIASKSVIEGMSIIKDEIEKQKLAIAKLRLDFETAVAASTWKIDFTANKTSFEAKKLELEADGINDIANFEKFTIDKNALEIELQSINDKEAERVIEVRQRSEMQEGYLDISKEISRKRKEFVTATLHDDKIKINIKSLRNRNDYIQRLRFILQKDTEFEKDLEALADKCFYGNVETNIVQVRKIFVDLKNGLDVEGISGYFKGLVGRISNAQIDEIELLFPEDDIEVQYKPNPAATFKSLSTASAGQKTTAILTFILSYGKSPLILDQPEDDLDNRLVYELIVDRLKQAKNQRQIIVVTHNANIPVNGDAEFIISMNSESKALEVLYSGTVEQPHIKKEICDVMEGTEQAFDMRSKRYKQI
ncbi:TrlF family AAA-like ATPase [Flavobacterium sp. LB3P45]|uniref:TrlF family AAA-like ATPase n=1 Tax=Flavobacterium fructosi TaxID=3230416 RepID=A0ABW6HJP6_9FLAO